MPTVGSMTAAIAAAALALAPTGCSFFALKTLPDGTERGDDPDCDDGFGTPGIDAVVAVLSGVLAVNLFAASGNRDADASGLRAGGFAATGVGAVFLAGTAYGVVHVNRCREVMNREGLRGKPPVREWDAPQPGALGGPCRETGACDGELVCDEPMKTCVPLEPTDEDMEPPR